jgi:hypothetical protein
VEMRHQEQAVVQHEVGGRHRQQHRRSCRRCSHTMKERTQIAMVASTIER